MVDDAGEHRDVPAAQGAQRGNDRAGRGPQGVAGPGWPTGSIIYLLQGATPPPGTFAGHIYSGGAPGHALALLPAYVVVERIPNERARDLLLVILGVVRSGRASVAAYAVGGYIAAAYWFTSSTSFANPARLVISSGSTPRSCSA